MTVREKALAVSSPSLALFVATLGWNLWDRRDTLAERGVRVLGFTRD